VEEERLRLEDGRLGRRRLTPGRTAGEAREREDGGGRETGNSATLVRFGMSGESGGVVAYLDFGIRNTPSQS
jgi:hypothetical protein